MAKPVDPEKYYQIYADHFVRKLNYREIAELRGISTGTISNAVKWVDEKLPQFTQPELFRGAVESTRDRIKWLKEQSREVLREIKEIQALPKEQQTPELRTEMRGLQRLYLNYDAGIGRVEEHLHRLQGLLKGVVLFDESSIEGQVAGYSKEFQELIDEVKKDKGNAGKEVSEVRV